MRIYRVSDTAYPNKINGTIVLLMCVRRVLIKLLPSDANSIEIFYNPIRFTLFPLPVYKVNKIIRHAFKKCRCHSMDEYILIVPNRACNFTCPSKHKVLKFKIYAHNTPLQLFYYADTYFEWRDYRVLVVHIINFRINQS